MTWPWFISDVKGSTKSSIPMSCSTFVKKRLYSRCRIACSTPPTYWSTGSHLRTSSGSNGPSSSFGGGEGGKYQDESTKVSIVSVSRFAGPPQIGHVVLTHASF